MEWRLASLIGKMRKMSSAVRYSYIEAQRLMMINPTRSLITKTPSHSSFGPNLSNLGLYSPLDRFTLKTLCLSKIAMVTQQKYSVAKIPSMKGDAH